MTRRLGEGRPTLTEILGRSPKVSVIYNPEAGKKPGLSKVHRAVQVLTGYNWNVTLEETQRVPNSATRLAQRAVAKKFDLVIAAGGDGTVGQVSKALVGTEVVLATLPLGGVNVFAREINIPSDSQKAAHALAKGAPRSMDTGTANGEHFLLWAGLGAGATSLLGVHRPGQFRTARGQSAYQRTVIRSLLGGEFTSFEADMSFNDTNEHFDSAVDVTTSNIRRYATVQLRPDARVDDDGQFEVTVTTGRTGRSLVAALPRVLTSGNDSNHSSRHLTKLRTDGSETIIAMDRYVPYHIEGEPIGDTDKLTIVSSPSALTVLVPQGEQRSFSKNLKFYT